MAKETPQRAWSNRQTNLRALLDDPDRFDESIPFFLGQHAALHSVRMASGIAHSFEDEVFEGLSPDRFRRIPPNCEHSIAWCIWHISRIEDITMNMLVAGTPQIFVASNWLEMLGIQARDTGNEISDSDLAAVSTAMNMDALRAYRLAVGSRTQEIVKALQPADLKQKIEPSRLQQVEQSGTVAPAARGIIDFWGRHTVAGLLMMPATRHPFVHLNECMRLKKKTA